MFNIVIFYSPILKQVHYYIAGRGFAIIQADSFGIHRCYAKVIPSAYSAELQVFFDKHIAQDANIRTDGWKGYSSLKERYPDIKQENSAKEKTFPLIHRQIMMFKAWLIGTHHHCFTCKISMLLNALFYCLIEYNQKSIS